MSGTQVSSTWIKGEPFATVAELEIRWRPLTDDEKAKASVLLGDASAVIRSQKPDIDDLIIEGLLDEVIPQKIVCDMTRRQMALSQDIPPVSQSSETVGVFSASYTFANPSGDMFLTKFEKKLLSIGSGAAHSVFFDKHGKAHTT
jgi:hypothetical protein